MRQLTPDQCLSASDTREAKRVRIEHICFSAQRAFVRRLPNADELLTEIEETKSYHDEAYFSDAGQRDSNLEGVRTLARLEMGRLAPCEAYSIAREVTRREKTSFHLV
jgi:maleate cis-trans isomerase